MRTVRIDFSVERVNITDTANAMNGLCLSTRRNCLQHILLFAISEVLLFLSLDCLLVLGCCCLFALFRGIAIIPEMNTLHTNPPNIRNMPLHVYASANLSQIIGRTMAPSLLPKFTNPKATILCFFSKYVGMMVKLDTYIKESPNPGKNKISLSYTTQNAFCRVNLSFRRY